MLSRGIQKLLSIAGLFLVIVYILHKTNCRDCWQGPTSKKTSVISRDGVLYEYDRQSPIIFIGGFPRSGTTLMRAMLDAHPEVRCGEETRLVPRILQMREKWVRSEKESMRLEEAGITGQVIASAVSSFILELIVRHGEPAARLCNKDPFTLKSGTFVRELFPNSKFLFMVRDGRASVHSMISRNVTITGFNLRDPRQCLERWNNTIAAMYDQCEDLGFGTNCLPVIYEQLVLHPEKELRRILNFLEVPWNDRVLHHEAEINKKNGIRLSKVEKSTDQVIKPVNIEALSKWVGHFPDDVIADMANIAPMLSSLGYNPSANPPKYGEADQVVMKNTKDIREHDQDWNEIAEKVRSLSKKDMRGMKDKPAQDFSDFALYNSTV